jgi:ribonucleoside-diphosphate reductase alpha chain
MKKLSSFNFEIKEIKRETVPEKVAKEEKISKPLERPYVIDAKVYKLKSRFAEHSIFITIGYIKEGNKVRPFEIFINSKDLTRAAEFAVLTRLLSAIFRRFEDPIFILEELRSIYDPNKVGYWKNGKYIHSLYGEIAEVIEEFFREMGIIKKEEEKKNEEKLKFETATNIQELNLFQICPHCNLRTLKIEGNCYTCVNPDCGYTKCD